VVAEGAKPKGGKRSVLEKRLGAAERLGGMGEQVSKALGEMAGRETRPLAEGRTGVMVALDPPTVRYVPLAQATERMKTVPLNCDTILTARELGICLGD
jgi:6-phosphofructokinase 1